MSIVSSGSITLTDLNDSKQLMMYIGSSRSRTVIFDPNTGVYNPNYVTANQVLTSQLFIAGTSTDIISSAKSISWSYKINGVGAEIAIPTTTTDHIVGTSGSKPLTLRTNLLSTNTTITYICEIVYTDTSTGFDVTSKAEIELVKATNGVKGTGGVDAIIGVLSNESHTIPTNSAGGGGNYTGATTQMYIYKGSVDDSANWAVTAVAGAGVTGTLAGKKYTVTNLTTDVGEVTLTAKRSGYAEVVKVFKLTRSKAGVDGTTPTTYWLIASVPAVGKSKTGVYTPKTITVSSKSQTGTASPINYAGRFIISDSTNGTTYTDRVTSTTNESSKTYTVGTNVVSVRVRMYLAGGITNLLDEQIIPVVVDGSDGSAGSDGTDGVSSVMASVWTPEGNTLKNSIGTLKAVVDVYNGTTKVTPTAFKWYIQDPTATVSSGGDADGGAGWRVLTSTYNAGVTGYTTSTIVIPAGAIFSVQAFMSVVTYKGKKYKDICTVIDVTDPIVVTITGLNIFRNGQGSSELTATLYREGVEIDALGTGGYTYSWTLYKENGSLDSTFGTKLGKKITVNSGDFFARANLLCRVSK